MGTVLGILGSTLPPLARSRHKKLARDSLVTELHKYLTDAKTLGDIDYALVSMDKHTSPWICNFLRNEKIPYIVVEAKNQEFTPKLSYWRNQAIDRLVVDIDDSEPCQKIVTIVADFSKIVQAKQPKDVQEKRFAYAIRNMWIIDHSDDIFLCCLSVDAEVTENNPAIRFFLRKHLFDLARQEKKRVWLWGDHSIAKLLQDSHNVQVKKSITTEKVKKLNKLQKTLPHQEDDWKNNVPF